MKRLALVLIIGLLACAPAGATFEIDDPLQQIEDLRATQETENAKAQGSSYVVLEKRDYLKLLIGNYVHGFNEFDTTVQTSNDEVLVGIYYRPVDQDKGRAEQLAKRFRKELPMVLDNPGYPWAKEVAIQVSVRQAPIPDFSD